MGLKKYLALALLALPFLCVDASGQHTLYRVTRSAGGMVLVWDWPGNQFTLEVKGKDVQAGLADRHGRLFFEADDILLLVQPAIISDFVKRPDASGLGTPAILRAHMDWEAQYIESEVLGKKLDVKAAPQKLADGRDVLLWEYEVPEGTDFPYKQMVHLTVRSGDNFVLMLHSQLKSRDQAGAARQLLLNTAATIKPTATPHNGQLVLEYKRH